MRVPILPSALLMAGLMGLPVGTAWADPGDAAAGQVIVQAWCSNCHLVGPGSAGLSRDAVPSFAAVARMPSTTSLSIHAFLQTPHGQMPDFALSRVQIDDIAAYVLGLKNPAG